MMHPVEKEREERFRKAKAKVESLKGFYSHLFFYVFINLLIFGLNYFTTPGLWWFYWPLIGWSLGLLAHFISVFVLPKFLGQKWEDRMLKKMLDEN